MQEFKYIIIGRGLAGLSLALRMAEAGHYPLVIGAPEGSENASCSAQGIVCNKGLIFAESPLFKAKLQSHFRLRPWLKKLTALSQIIIPQHIQGVVEPYWHEADFQKTVQRIYRGNFWGCYRAQNHPGSLWQAAISKSTRKPLGFLEFPDDGWFDVKAALKALEVAATRLGAKFLDCSISSIERSSRGLLLRSHGERWMTSHLVLAAGAGTEKLLEYLNLKMPKSFLIGGQSLSWRHQSEAFLPEAQRVIVKATLSLAVDTKTSILGSSSWKHSDSQLPDLIADGAQLLRQGQDAFGLQLTEAERESAIHSWGVRLRFADRMPALGRWPEIGWSDQLSLLTGFYKNGLQLADICAEQLWLELTDQSLNSTGHAFHLRRLFRN